MTSGHRILFYTFCTFQIRQSVVPSWLVCVCKYVLWVLVCHTREFQLPPWKQLRLLDFPPRPQSNAKWFDRFDSRHFSSFHSNPFPIKTNRLIRSRKKVQRPKGFDLEWSDIQPSLPKRPFLTFMTSYIASLVNNDDVIQLQILCQRRKGYIIRYGYGRSET